MGFHWTFNGTGLVDGCWWVPSSNQTWLRFHWTFNGTGLVDGCWWVPSSNQTWQWTSLTSHQFVVGPLKPTVIFHCHSWLSEGNGYVVDSLGSIYIYICISSPMIIPWYPHCTTILGMVYCWSWKQNYITYNIIGKGQDCGYSTVWKNDENMYKWSQMVIQETQMWMIY